MKKTTSLILGLTLLLCVALAAQLSAQAQVPLWKTANTELQNDGKQFVITLERSSLGDGQRNDAQIKKIMVMIQSDNTLISYAPNGAMPFEKITIDLGNKTELTSLSELLGDFSKVSKTQKARAAAHFVATGDAGRSVSSFSGALGDFNVEYEIATWPGVGDGMYGGSIKLNPKDGDQNKFRSIVEPTALEQVILSVENLRQMQQEAIQIKEKRLAAEKALQEKKAQEEIAAAKAAEAERQKELEQKHQEKLRELGHQEELTKIQAVGAAREQQRNQELAQAKQERVKKYLRTPFGFLLAGKIGNLSERVKETTREEFETKKENIQIAKNYASENFKNGGYTAKDLVKGSFLVGAVEGYPESKELRGMRADLQKLLIQFEEKCGVSYDEACNNGGEATIRTAMAIRKFAPPILFLLVAGILIYRAAQQDKRGMAPKWYLMGKSIIQNIQAISKEKDPEKRRALIKAFSGAVRSGKKIGDLPPKD